MIGTGRNVLFHFDNIIFFITVPEVNGKPVARHAAPHAHWPSCAYHINIYQTLAPAKRTNNTLGDSQNNLLCSSNFDF